MKILGALVERHEHLRDIQVPIGSSTLLFGRNAAGKSTVLEALISGWHRRDPDSQVGYAVMLGEMDSAFLADVLSYGASRQVTSRKLALENLTSSFDMSKIEGPDDVDFQSLHDMYLSFSRALAEAEKLLPVDASWASSIQELRRRLTQHTPQSESIDGVCEQLLAEPVILIDHQKVSSRAVDLEQALAAAGVETRVRRRASLGVDKRTLQDQQLGAWVSAVADLPEQSPLRTAVMRLLSDAGPLVAVFELGPVYGDDWAAPAPAIVFDASTEGLEAAIEASVPSIFASLVGSWLADGDHSLAFDKTDDSDPWFRAVDPGYDDDVFELRPGIRDVLAVIETTANDIAPPFVQHAGTIKIDPVRLDRMTLGPKVQISFETNGMRLPLDRIGAGTQRWVSAVVREACRALTTLERTYIEIDGDPHWAREEDLDEVVWELCDEPLRLEDVDYHLPPAPGIFLADEPELHLHPVAVSDARTWLEERSQHGLSVVAATHSPRLLNMSSQLAEHIHVAATTGGPVLRRVGPELLTFLTEQASEAGMEPGDVLQLTRAIAIVEGKHDVEVIQHFYAAELAAARVLLLRLEGTGNSNALVEAEFLASGQLPMRVLFDNVSSTSMSHTDEERVAGRLLARARELDVDLVVVPFELPDIIAALPESAVRRAFSEARFDGWAPLVERWRQLRRHQFKRWALAEMGLGQVHATQFIRRVLEMTEVGERPSPSLERAVKELLAI